MERNLPKRKRNRLECYDYSTPGAYFITICTKDRKNRFWTNVGASIARPQDVVLSPYGKIVDECIQCISTIYPALRVEYYVIMPNHIHAIFVLQNETAGASPRPTIMDIVCAYKSLTTIECKRNGFVDNLFQTSFHEHIVRGRDDYEEIVKYIYENPMRWYYDELYLNE